MGFPDFDERSQWRERGLVALWALWNWSVDSWRTNRGYFVAAVSGSLGMLLAIWLLLSAFWGWLFWRPVAVTKSPPRGIPEEPVVPQSRPRPPVRPRLPGRPLEPLFAQSMPEPSPPPEPLEVRLTPVAQEEEDEPFVEVVETQTARFDRTPAPIETAEPEPEPEEEEAPVPAWADDEPLVAERDEPRAPIQWEEEPEPEPEPEPELASEPEPEPEEVLVDWRLEPQALDPEFADDGLMAQLLPPPAPPPPLVEHPANSDWKPAAPRPEPAKTREDSAPTTTRVVPAAVVPAAVVQERRPRLALRWQDPPAARPGAIVTINLLVSNVGDAPAQRVELSLRLPAVVGHPEGDDLEQDVGTLQVGETRLIPLIVKPSVPGQMELPVTARAVGAEASSVGTLRVSGTPVLLPTAAPALPSSNTLPVIPPPLSASNLR
ncbi:MAG: hypothetical protein ACK5TO_14490 [Planctomycetaceae bacterium]